MPTDPDHEFSLGQPSPTLSLLTVEQVEDVISTIFHLAEHHIDVRAVRLDYEFFNSEELSQSVTNLITASTRNRVRFLIEDEFHFNSSQPRIMHLARSFSSYVKVHKLLDEQQRNNEFFIVADQVCFMHQTSDHKYPVRAALYAPGQSKMLTQKFTDGWYQSQQISELFTTGLC